MCLPQWAGRQQNRREQKKGIGCRASQLHYSTHPPIIIGVAVQKLILPVLPIRQAGQVSCPAAVELQNCHLRVAAKRLAVKYEMMNYRNLLGIDYDQLEWKKIISFLLALWFPSVMIFAISFLGEGPNLEIITTLVYNVILFSTSILVINVLKFKSEFISISVISIITGLVGSALNIANTGWITYVHFILSTFVMLYCWASLIKLIKRRKLVLVIGYFLSSMISLIFVVADMSQELLEIPSSLLIVQIGSSFIAWTIWFWIGLLIFDKIFGIKAQLLTRGVTDLK